MSKEIEKYIESIRLLVPINELSPQVQNEVAQKAKFITVKKNKFLFQQGDTDNFSYYLLDGELDLIANKQLQNSIQAGSERALYAMAQLQPRQMSAKAKVVCTVLQIERDVLDKFMVAANTGGMEVDDDGLGVEMGVVELDEEEDLDWMTRMLQSELFLNMPTANMHQLFASLEPVEYNAGDAIIKQGDPGEHYYIIQEGHCEVSRQASEGAKPIKLAELKPGDSFGEEALLMETTRNATITMMAPGGIVASLSKDSFIELIKKPTLAGVNFKKGSELIEAGAVWLDVRFENEFKESNIEGATNIPLNILRMQTDKLDPAKQYVAYCDTGGRSAAGAFLLAERGFQASYLQGGLISYPDAASTTGEAAAPAAEPAKAEAKKEEPKQAEAPKAETKKEEPKKETPKAEPKKAAPKKEPEKVEEPSKEVAPAVREAAIDVELERTNIRLQEAEKLRAEVDAAKKKAQEEIKEKLEEERKRLEDAKKQAADEVKKLKEEEQKKIEQMKAEAEKQLQEEKKKLEEIYSKNTEEMEEIQRLKEQAEAEAKQKEEQIKKEAEEAQKKLEEAKRLQEEQEKQRASEAEEAKKILEEAKRLKEEQEKKQTAESEEAKKILEEAKRLKEEEEKKRASESDEAKKMLEEAKRLKEEAEAARKAAEQEAADKAKTHEEMQKQLQEQAKAKIEEEKRKLAEQLAKNNEVLEQAQKEKDMADAARAAAHEEAQRIIEEYKKEQEAATAEKEAELEREREELEKGAEKIQATMIKIQEEKLTAEKEKLDAQKQVAMLKIKQQQKKDAADKETIKEEIKAIEAKVDEASKHLEEVEDAEKQAEEAKQLNDEGMEKHDEEIQRLRDEVRQDLETFVKETEEAEKNAPKFETDPEYMKRLQEKAEEAKRQEEAATENLFADISSMLSSESEHPE